MDDNILDRLFDDLLFQTQRGKITHEQLERNVRFEQFEQVKDWKLKYGYRFNIYGNDHFIDGRPHFHFDNNEAKIFCKVDFDGNVLEFQGTNEIPNNIHKELLYFLSKETNRKRIIDLWNQKNPMLLV